MLLSPQSGLDATSVEVPMNSAFRPTSMYSMNVPSPSGKTCIVPWSTTALTLSRVVSVNVHLMPSVIVSTSL